MNRRNVLDLAARQVADATECERLRKRLYALMDEWKPLMARQREHERQFIDADLRARSDNRPLTRRGRRRRLQELLELNVQTHHLQSALAWVEQRRVRMLDRLQELDED